MNDQLKDYGEVLQKLYQADPEGDWSKAKALLMQAEGPWSIQYAPFEYINRDAKLVIVGVTPGTTQANLALKAAAQAMMSGMDIAAAAKLAKTTASFGGAMRASLIQLLDNIGLNVWLGLPSCRALFEEASHLVHYTSVLRYPVFKNGENYSGSPDPLAQPLLRQFIEAYFADECAQLQNAIFVPLGAAPTKVCEWLVSMKRLNEAHVLSGLPHPSPANRERIDYFLGNKPAEKLSIKTNAASIDASKKRILGKVSTLSA